MKLIIKKFRLLFVFLYFCATTCFMTYPIAFHLKDSVIGGMGDDIYFVWLVRWYQKVFVGGNWHPFFNPWMNYPQGWNLSTTDTSLATALPGVPFSLWLGPIAGYNIAMLITFVFSGLFMYLWVHHLSHSQAAGLLAGTIFAFAPNHMAHFIAGHLNLCGIQWFPLYFWGLYDMLNPHQKFDWRSVLLMSFGLSAIAFTSMYYLYMTLLISAAFVLSYLFFTRFKFLRNKQFWLQLAVAVLIAIPFLYVALRPFISLSDAGVIASRSMEYASMYSASPTDFFIPSSDHFLWGKEISRLFDRSLWMEGSLYIGVVGFVLTLLALLQNKNSNHRWLIWSGMIVIIVSFVLALGINLHWNNRVVIAQVPALLQPLLHRSTTVINLPDAWLFIHLPFFDKMRALMRFGTFALVFVPVLAGLGFNLIQKGLSTHKNTLLSTCCILIVFFDFYPGSYAGQLSQPQPRAVDLWLANQPGQGAVVQMPFIQSTDQAQLYYTLFYNKPFVGGFFNANQPPQYQNIQSTLDQFPEANSVELLRKLKVEYIVVDKNSYSDFSAVQEMCSHLGLIQLTDLEGQAVFTFGGS